MKNNIRAEFRPDSLDLINFIISHFRKFVYTGLAAAIISAVISLMIKPLYESTVTMYPSSNITGATTLLGEVTSGTEFFGDEDATERLIQVVSSGQIREYLKVKYDLFNHYKVKPGEKYPNTVIAGKMDKYIHCSKTSFGSVEISVRDRDREIACAMANDMAARADTVFNNLQRTNASVMLDDISRSYEAQYRVVKQYEDSLSRSVGASALSIYATLETENEYLGLIRGKYLEVMALSKQVMPYIVIVDRAGVAEKKIYPRRSIMVIVSTASALILLALILFVAEGVKLHRTDDRQ
jgi:hypothetical protein